MVQLEWLVSAKDDIKDIYDFIAEDSKKYAKYQVLGIKHKTNILKSNPFVGKKVEEFNNENIREIIYSHYRIIYLIISPKLIHIILVHHGARNFPRKM
jgi:toxin ParE1/3/4